ncbi:tetratricopeptide repeat protein [Salibacterium salarium]|uniref:Tetratricopeptide repeat protein n=1 Tax=Salibacterium salarium TaxID=284579 RepID=A0A3R9Q049_9BACI|nr:tetratricopeptide repeat protein [Salibacterium salarium]RSL30760.1 tetratricopeptide repeat protein [Salibacterium salarium]
MMKTEDTQGQVIPFIQNGEYFFKRGVHAYQKKELQRAVKYLRRAIELNPDQGVFQCQLAAIYSDMGEYNQSIDMLLYVLNELDETMYECYFFLANNYAYQGLFDKAAETAHSYLHFDPEGDFAQDTRDLLEMLEMDQEEETESEATDADDELIITYEKSLRMIKEEKYYEAEMLLENIVTDYPTYWPAQSQLSRVLYLKGHIEEALAYTKDLLRENHYLPAVCQLAVFYKEAGRNEEAQDTADVLKQTVPMNKDHLFHLASTLCLLEEYGDAYRFFKMFKARFTPEDANFFFQYGVAAFEMGRPQEAKSQWQRAKNMHHAGASAVLEKMEQNLLFSSDVSYESWMCHRV